MAPGKVRVPFSVSTVLIIPRNGKKALFFLAGFSGGAFLSSANVFVSVSNPPKIKAADNRGMSEFFIVVRFTVQSTPKLLTRKVKACYGYKKDQICYMLGG